jgi:DNA-binding winged helix-turn-helix (wHTH) protein
MTSSVDRLGGLAMSVAAIGPSRGAGPHTVGPHAVGPHGAGSPQLTITVQVTVSGPVVPGVASQVLREIQEFADRMNAGRVTLRPVVEPDSEPHPAQLPAHGPRLRVVPDARVVLVDGEPAQLTRREFDLLLFLCRNRLRVVSREELLSQVWGYAWTGGTRTVDVHIRRLRMKLGHDVLSTVHGVGYRIDDRVRLTVERDDRRRPGQDAHEVPTGRPPE